MRHLPPQSAAKQEIMDRVHAMASRFAERSRGCGRGSAHTARVGGRHARSRPCAHFDSEGRGGYGLGFDTWFEVTRELSKADASHGWCCEPDHSPQSSHLAVPGSGPEDRLGCLVSMSRSRYRLCRWYRPLRSMAAIAFPARGRRLSAASIIAPG